MSALNELMVAGQPLWTGAMACYPYSAKYKGQFSLTSRFGDPYDLYKVLGDKIMLPRAVCPVGKDDLRVRGVPQSFDNCKFQPRNDEQLRAVMACRGNLAEDRSFVFQSPTGSGKTACTMPLIKAVGRTTLVVVPKEDLLDRWNEDLRNILGLKPQEIGIMQADNFQFSGKKVVVGMLQSLAKINKYPPWIKQELGFVVFDEVHRLGAEHFLQVAGAYPAMLRLGLSATPQRSDGKENAFLSHIGPIRVSIDVEQQIPKVLRVHTGWRMPRTKSGDKLQHAPGRDAHVRRLLFDNKERNAMIVRSIKASHAKGRKIVVFTDYIDHVHVLYEATREAGIPAFKMGLFIGTGVSKADLDKALGKDVIFATFGKMSEGTNVPWLDTCVLAGPRSNVTQTVGRIRREYEGKATPVVIDFIDDDSFVYKAFASARLKWYESLGATVIKGTF